VKQTSSPEELEQELRKAIQVYTHLKSSRRRKPSNRDLAEYNLGVARGIIHTLEALGYTDMVAQFKRSLEEETTPQDKDASSVEAFFKRRLLYSRGRLGQ